MLDFSQELNPASPCVIYSSKANRVVQVSQGADDAGIQVGMGMAQTAALCPDLSIIPYDEEQETALLNMLAEHLYLLASDIVVIPPNGLALNIDRLLHYYHGLMPLWHTINSALRIHRVTFHYASGLSMASARVLAENAWDQVTTEKQRIKENLAGLPVTSLTIPGKHLTRLQRVGISHIGHLLTLDNSEISQRFDNQLLQYLCELRGDIAERVTFFRPAEKFSLRKELDYDIEQATALLPELTSLIQRACQFLRIRNRLTMELEFSLSCRDAPPVELRVAAAQATHHVDSWLSLTELRVGQLNLNAPVTHIKLCISHDEEGLATTEDFFNNRHHYFARMQLIGRLQARLGTESLFQVFPGDDHRFEFVTQAQPDKKVPPTLLPGHPTLLLNHPLPLNHNMHIEYGPIRIQTGWWDKQKIKRDYFIARTTDGRRASIFRENSESWFVHGWFC